MHGFDAKDRNDFWLELGPAAEWAGMDAQERADLEGDASPDGRRHGFYGAEQGTVYQPRSAFRDDLSPITPPDVPDGVSPTELPPVPPEIWPGL